MFNLFMNDMPMPGNTFKQQYKCYSMSMFSDREKLENGGKIIMPPSALDMLTRLHIQYPMLFKLTNSKNRHTHCGVLEFCSEEGRIHIPYWMMKNLNIQEGETIHLENVALSVASFAKFQPAQADFLEISNPKAVLENALRDFACLTKGDVIAINYNNHIFELSVLETKPKDAVTIIECDMQVEFAAPIGYEETCYKRSAVGSSGSKHTVRDDDDDKDEIIIPQEAQDKYLGFQAFKGQGVRLDGKRTSSTFSKSTSGNSTASTVSPQSFIGQSGDLKSSSGMSSEFVIPRGIPNYDYQMGTLEFIRHSKLANGTTPLDSANSNSEENNEQPSFKAFNGEGFKLRTAKSKRNGDKDIYR